MPMCGPWSNGKRSYVFTVWLFAKGNYWAVNILSQNLAGEDNEQVLLDFISQYYLNQLYPEGLPSTLVVALSGEQIEPLLEAIKIQQARKLIHGQGARPNAHLVEYGRRKCSGRRAKQALWPSRSQT